ncbi:hypothetical protein [Schlesneria paludicola]|uniref:hypothetical protein n=1 Tax=Schlesneria paludicola TaxID=360056 RepID=UPI0012FB7F9E|nr:hypothetical protein [Schlesneria paludicola]
MQLDAKRALHIVVVGLVCDAVVGCGGAKTRDLPKAPVVGTVSYSKPFPHGEVIFKHHSGEITVAKFSADGAYRSQVPQGRNTVIVRAQTSSRDANRKPGPEMEVFTNHIPARYGDFGTSKLEYTVESGTNKFDIALVD